MDTHLPDDLQVVWADERDQGDRTRQTGGFVRRELMAQRWGLARSDSYVTGKCFGLDHHGDYDTYSYALAGNARIEIGPGGGSSYSAQPVDLVFVQNAVIHREVNTATEDNVALVCRIGNGATVFHVKSPASAE